jgi:hypothetical protein
VRVLVDERTVRIEVDNDIDGATARAVAQYVGARLADVADTLAGEVADLFGVAAVRVEVD